MHFVNCGYLFNIWCKYARVTKLKFYFKWMISMDRLRLMGCIHNMQILNYIINDEIYYKWLNRALMILTLSVGFFICGFIKKWEVRLIEYFIYHPFISLSNLHLLYIQQDGHNFWNNKKHVKIHNYFLI